MKKLLAAALTAPLILAGCSGESGQLDVPPASNEFAPPAGLSWFSRAAMDTLCRFSVWRGADSGYIAMFAHNGAPIHSLSCGWKDIASESAMTLDTHLRIASMTKPITAVLAMTLVEEGKLGLDDTVAQYLPEFSDLEVATDHAPDASGNYPTRPASNPLLVRHLLMFSSGIGPGRQEDSQLVDQWNNEGIYRHPAGGDLGQRVSRLSQLPLLEEPGTQWRYGFSADVLGSIIETVTGQTIAQAMDERVFEPLGMTDTRFLPLPDQRDEMATVYTMDANGELQVAPLIFDNEGWTPGGGGLVSTISDYMRFALMLWNDGEYQGQRILQAETVKQMTELHVPGGVLEAEGIEGLGWGLGMAVVADAEATITPDNTGDFWWSGYYGTTFFVSPSTDFVGVIMSQRQPSEFAERPIEIFLFQGLAQAGLQN